MSVIIDLIDETDTLQETHKLLVEQIIIKTVEYEQVKGEVEVSVTFVDEGQIQQINAQYRNKDHPTDVISFALNEESEEEVRVIGDGLPNMLGDIIISVSHIQRQADEYNHSFERELGFLTVHGMLHLLGYDHITEAEEKEMFSRQENILMDYGLTR
ncbi:rRNA maturation RNase YbeY [Halalkalibacter sp. APA_J-10(15)]|uniref:rRNA maturation RNase YbeY n=1 Tax=unclassified Halalkalibacter TaxID=2893063 RepID=UPI001FF50BBF|nr:rRNA maturation RNase YbeY [Halalkalibacter sp. APA_J-10(15)]MCK0471565.1 rRNA maturation RNase YbeY [Halalkalibacter sp. APA_J-10(15)]